MLPPRGNAAAASLLLLLLVCFFGVAVVGSEPNNGAGGVRCESVEFIISADGLARRLAERGLGDAHTAKQVAAFFAAEASAVCAHTVAERLYRGPKVGACTAAQGPGGCDGTASASNNDKSVRANADADGYSGALGSGAVPRLDERTKRVARALAGVAAVAADAIASAPSASGRTPSGSAHLHALFLSVATAVAGLHHKLTNAVDP
jgi:hypothetical protein